MPAKQAPRKIRTDNHAWFHGFRSRGRSEGRGHCIGGKRREGGGVAAPMAKRLMEAALGQEITPWQTPTPSASGSTDAGRSHTDHGGRSVKLSEGSGLGLDLRSFRPFLAGLFGGCFRHDP